MQKGAQSLRALPLWLARDVSCKGSSSDISFSQYFLLWISAQWCMNASVPLNWTEASHWDRANMEGSRCRNINHQSWLLILVNVLILYSGGTTIIRTSNVKLTAARNIGSKHQWKSVMYEPSIISLKMRSKRMCVACTKYFETINYYY